MDLEGVARELYRLPPEEFVAERAARQRNIRSRDRALATAVGGLRKPAPAAWVVALLAADGSLDEAVDLGPTLREAQARADPAEIATLRRQRAAVVAALARSGAERAAEAGHPVTDAVLDQVRGTIEAAMSDERAGAAVRSGLLLRPLESAGFEEVDLDGAVAVPEALPFPTSRPVAEPVPIASARRGSGRRAAAAPADRRTGGPARGDDGRDTRAGESDGGDHGTDVRGAADADRASRPSRSGRRARPDTGDAERDAARPDAAGERRAARAAETEARAASRAADAELDAVEEALVAAESERDRLEQERREHERALRTLEAETAALARRIDELDADRAAAESASDRARDALAAARGRRRTGRAG